MSELGSSQLRLPVMLMPACRMSVSQRLRALVFCLPSRDHVPVAGSGAAASAQGSIRCMQLAVGTVVGEAEAVPWLERWTVEARLRAGTEDSRMVVLLVVVVVELVGGGEWLDSVL